MSFSRVGPNQTIERGQFRVAKSKRRRRWTIEIKRRIAEESIEGSTSVAQLAQKYAVNANQIFKWRKDYREEGLKNSVT